MRWSIHVATTAVLTISLIGAVSCSSSSESNTSNNGKQDIRIALSYAHVWSAWTAVGDKDRHIPGVKVHTTPFDSSNDGFVALQTGKVDMAPVCVGTLSSGLAKHKLDMDIIAGLSPGRSEALVRTGSNINSFADLKGKKVAQIRGSNEAVKARIMASAAGVNLNKDSDVINVENPSDQLLALKRGDADAAVTYNPNTAKAVRGGYAKSPSGMNKKLEDQAGVACNVVVNKKFEKSHPKAVQNLVNEYIKIWNKFKDRDKWVHETLKHQKGNKKDLLTAAKDWKIWYRMEEKPTTDITSKLARYDATPKDNGDQLIKLFNYKFLKNATGKSAKQLGAKDSK